eukprot:snap_masked-scaffold_8-processed-gene-8.33-mRNA-1 protein AED:0.08 eAED:0.08 QI:0/-1/0/1/-1/1/1/0/219
MPRFGKRAKAPPGFEYIQTTLEALEREQTERTNDSHEGISKSESLWAIHQLNWQKTRYVYDMFYKYKRISRHVYEYCLRQKYADKDLIAKWKKQGYEKLCSTLVIDPRNFPFGTVSICRVPRNKLDVEEDEEGEKLIIKSDITGCLGCASGKKSLKNIFGNKYGQRLAKVQILREKKQKEGQTAKKDTKDIWFNSDEELNETDESDDEEDQPSKRRKTG